MSVQPLRRTDRRHVRREQTIEQLIDVAVEVMGEQGVAGLSIGEVARRMGIRPPSLYVYFPSKNAVYDAVFIRGWLRVMDAMEALPAPDDVSDLPGFVQSFGEAFVAWMVSNPVYTQLMAWRPVPGYEPSAEAYAPAIVALGRGRETFAALQARGLFDPDVDPDELLRAWTVLTSGVITQQLANAPGEPYENGTFTTMLPQLISMFLAHYAPRRTTAPPTSGEGMP